MRVLIVYHAGAMENARRIYQALAQTSEVELTAIVPQKLQVERVYDSNGWLSVEREEDHDGYRLVPLPLRNPSNYGRGFEISGLHRLIKRIKPDIIHVFDEANSNYLLQVIWQGLLASPCSRVLFYGFENLPLRLGWRSPVWKFTWGRMSGGVTASTEALENLRRSGFPQDLPLDRVFWGIPTDIFRPMDVTALKEELGFGFEHAVGFVGRFIPEKGLDVLMSAVGYLPNDLHYMIIGSGPMRADLERWSGLPGLRGRVHLRDVMPPEDLARYINCMSVLVVPSLTVPRWKEQYGRVLAEAMACGVPVVGSDSGAIPEVVGSAGFIVPEGNPAALAESVYRAIFNSEDRERLRQLGLIRADQELSVEAMAKRLIGFYGRVLES